MFTKITDDYIKSLSLSERKSKGQYMTPEVISSRMVKLLQDGGGDIRGKKVLDPAAGTGELLLAFKKQFPHNNFYAFDSDQNILKMAVKNLPEVNAVHMDIFSGGWRKFENTFDYIIGNPPYFEVTKNQAQKELHDFYSINESGRLNIYSLFFEYSLKLLKVGGELIFLTPPSINGGANFIKARENIMHNGYIRDFKIIRANNSFDEALTSAQIIHITKTISTFEENCKKSEKYIHTFKNDFIFTENKQLIKDFWKGKDNLVNYGFTVKTGNIDWSKYKNDFTVEGGGSAPLYYSKDISKSNILELSPKINSDRRYLPTNIGKIMREDSIIVNRITGSIENPKLKFALISGGCYFTENHVNVITHGDGDMLLKLYNYLLSLDSQEVSEYLKAITGNTQLSARELLYKFPIKL